MIYVLSDIIHDSLPRYVLYLFTSFVKYPNRVFNSFLRMMERERVKAYVASYSPLTCQDRSPEQRQQIFLTQVRPITHDNHRTVSYFHIRSSLLVRRWGCHSDRERRVDPQSSPPACLWENTGPAPERRSLGPWSVVCSLSPGPASQSEWTLPWRRKWWITQRWASHRYFVTIAVYCGE